MTADLEAVTRELLRVIPCEVFNAPATCLWSCEERTCDSCQKVAKLTAVLASLPDDRLAEAEAKVRRVEALIDANWPIPREAMGAFCIPTAMFSAEQRRELRAALSGGDAT